MLALLLTGCGLCTLSAQAQTINPVGSGFVRPTGIAVDGIGDVFVTDLATGQFQGILAAGGYTTVVPITSGVSPFPTGVAFPRGSGSDSPYLVYLDATEGISCLAPFDGTVGSSGCFSYSLGNEVGGQPRGIAVDGAGDIFVADAALGVYTIPFGGSGFAVPILSGSVNGVAVDGSGNVFVADSGNSAVEEIPAAGGYTTVNTLGNGFTSPWGVAVDNSGNIFVVDIATNLASEILAVGGSVPASSPTIITLGSGFNEPFGIAVDGSGNVFIADTFNGAVKEILAPPTVVIITLT